MAQKAHPPATKTVQRKNIKREIFEQIRTEIADCVRILSTTPLFVLFLFCRDCSCHPIETCPHIATFLKSFATSTPSEHMLLKRDVGCILSEPSSSEASFQRTVAILALLSSVAAKDSDYLQSTVVHLLLEAALSLVDNLNQMKAVSSIDRSKWCGLRQDDDFVGTDPRLTADTEEQENLTWVNMQRKLLGNISVLLNIYYEN